MGEPTIALNLEAARMNWLMSVGVCADVKLKPMTYPHRGWVVRRIRGAVRSESNLAYEMLLADGKRVTFHLADVEKVQKADYQPERPE